MRKALARVSLAALTLLGLAVLVYTVASARSGQLLFIAAAEGVRPVPSIIVDDQAIVDGMITAQQVVANQDGWITAHISGSNSKLILNQMVGTAAVKAGVTTDVRITVDESFAPGDSVLLMLHVDHGSKGLFEFPSSADKPVQMDGGPVTSLFSVLADASRPAGVIPAAGLSQLPTLSTVLLGVAFILIGWRVQNIARPRNIVSTSAQ